MFMDEARFGRINDVRRCWAPPGIRPVVPFQIVREYTYAYAAVCPFDGDLDALILPDVNAQSMSLFLQELSENHAHEHIVLILDRAAGIPRRTSQFLRTSHCIGFPHTVLN